MQKHFASLGPPANSTCNRKALYDRAELEESIVLPEDVAGKDKTRGAGVVNNSTIAAGRFDERPATNPEFAEAA
ncbi:hypothetical protein EAI_17404 [Harpegnathos saltator]|uniref:Uncharacterized protein n=1 Tax=Harpegnathos saltator TaxID=610380 RepID=E2BG82_HARSA|nr:hypothetical protein EAI_17404 [Harpegnathos saltator]